MKIKNDLDPLRVEIGGVKLQPRHVIQEMERHAHWIQTGFDAMELSEGLGNLVEALSQIGTLVLLGVIAEALVILAQMDARYGKVYDDHEHSLSEWLNMRHDMVHVMDRLFRVRNRRNPLIGEGTVQIANIGVTFRDEIGRLCVRTGDETPLIIERVRDELDTIVFECRVLDEGESPVIASAKSVYESATGQSAPDGPVTPEIGALLYREIRKSAGRP